MRRHTQTHIFVPAGAKRITPIAVKVACQPRPGRVIFRFDRAYVVRPRVLVCDLQILPFILCKRLLPPFSGSVIAPEIKHPLPVFRFDDHVLDEPWQQHLQVGAVADGPNGVFPVAPARFPAPCQFWE